VAQKIYLSVFPLLFVLSCATNGTKPVVLSGHDRPYKVYGKWYSPIKHARSFREKGIASWYGREFHGKKTSSGETYNMYALTAAHRTLPMGTYVKVRNLRNKKVVVVRINDRGPFVPGRIIDLSYRAARMIGIVGPGTAAVEIEALGMLREARVTGKTKHSLMPGNYYVGEFAIQIGAFKSKENALKLREKLANTYEDAHIVVYNIGNDKFYRVRVAKCATLDQARQYKKILRANGYPDAIIVAR